MSTDNDNAVQDVELTEVPDELTSLKGRADLMGIKYHPSVGLDALRKKINAAATAEGPIDEDGEVEADAGEPPVVFSGVETRAERRERVRRDATRLVRVKIVCMNPAKKEHEGDLFTVGNTAVGTISKYVPYSNEEGWHVPNMILDHLKERMCQIFVTKKDDRGNSIRVGKLIKEYNIEIMDPLTPAEMKALAQRQAMAAGTQ